MVARRVEGAFDLQVQLGGLEDLCEDAVELGEQSDASTLEALRLRRATARALAEAGIRKTDVAYLMGIQPDSVAHLLAVPVETAWMKTGHSPPTPFPRPREATTAAGTRRMTAVVATRNGTSWHVHLKAGRRPTGRTSLVHAEKLVRSLYGDTDILLCPQLPARLEAQLRASDLATAAAEDLQLQAYQLRHGVATRLRALGIGFADTGELLAMHAHRIRLLLA